MPIGHARASGQRQRKLGRLLYCYRAETAVRHGDHTRARPIKVQRRQLNPLVRVRIILLHRLQIRHPVIAATGNQAVPEQRHPNCVPANAQIRNLKWKILEELKKQKKFNDFFD